MKNVQLIILSLFLIITTNLSFAQSKKKSSNQSQMKQTTTQLEKKMETKELTGSSLFYSFIVKDINGNDFSFESLKGKKVLIVNTASKCGFTSQYADLETLYLKHKDSGLVVIGFPSNDFGNQEPGTNEKIAQFCSQNYGVTFPMMSKVSVKGEAMCEVYKYLTQKTKNGVDESKVDWNFQKYLINADGTLHKVYSSELNPMSIEITNWVQE